MKGEALLREGKLDEAVQELGDYLRDSPQDQKSRTFLFELLCFQGDFDRARKHLALLSSGGRDSAVAALLYEGAIRAEELRQEMFDSGDYPGPLAEDAAKVRGSLNGKPFSSIQDADPRIGARLEVFAAGDYLWLPFKHLASLQMQKPARLRDLLWATVKVRTGPGLEERELGEVLTPVLCPQTGRHPDGQVRLGRVTEWCRDEQGRESPYGQKMLLIDGEEIPLLELRSLEIEHQAAAA
jgi:type VI secretion system protein ImpE